MVQMQEDPRADGNCDTERWEGMWNGVARGSRRAGEGVERKPLGGMYGVGLSLTAKPEARPICTVPLAGVHASKLWPTACPTSIPMTTALGVGFLHSHSPRLSHSRHIVTVPDVYSTIWGQLAPIKCTVSCKSTVTVG